MRGEVEPYPLVQNTKEWDNDLLVWMNNPTLDVFYEDPFFNDVARPMVVAFNAHKENNNGIDYVNDIKATDWRLACYNWLYKRESQLTFGFDKRQ
jgi:hypothetical protein